MDMSQGDGADDLQGSWNSGELWERVSDREAQTAVDGGDGGGTVDLDAREQAAVQTMALRTLSDPEARPTTGAELGPARAREHWTCHHASHEGLGRPSAAPQWRSP